jgi:hypothetical protein
VGKNSDAESPEQGSVKKVKVKKRSGAESPKQSSSGKEKAGKNSDAENPERGSVKKIRVKKKSGAESPNQSSSRKEKVPKTLLKWNSKVLLDEIVDENYRDISDLIDSIWNSTENTEDVVERIQKVLRNTTYQKFCPVQLLEEVINSATRCIPNVDLKNALKGISPSLEVKLLNPKASSKDQNILDNYMKENARFKKLLDTFETDLKKLALHAFTGNSKGCPENLDEKILPFALAGGNLEIIKRFDEKLLKGKMKHCIAYHRNSVLKKFYKYCVESDISVAVASNNIYAFFFLISNAKVTLNIPDLLFESRKNLFLVNYLIKERWSDGVDVDVFFGKFNSKPADEEYDALPDIIKIMRINGKNVDDYKAKMSGDIGRLLAAGYSIGESKASVNEYADEFYKTARELFRSD